MPVLYEKKGRIAYVTLNRPKVNAINFDMLDELDKIWIDFREDNNLWVAILTGAGNVFSVGFDIKEILESLKRGEYRWRNSATFGDKSCGPITHSIWKPIVGALDGSVNGLGLWLVLGCDIRIATMETRFGLGEVRLNFPVEFAALMTRYMPEAIVNELLLTGNTISAERAYDVGFINKVVPREQLEPEATAMAHIICEGGPIAARVMKRLVKQGWDLDYDSAVTLSESMIVPVAVNSEDTKEGCMAFLEKRKPVWKCK